MQRAWRRGAALLGLAGGALLLLSAAPVRAHDGDDACASECAEARRVCRSAALAAWRACADDCSDAVREAAQHAREACQAGQLSPRECGQLIREAMSDALGSCRDDCRGEREIARALCQDERSECREACAADLDPVCVEGCQASFETCRGTLASCAAGCREAFAAARAACATDAVVDGACDVAAYRECVAAARDEAESCAHGCHEANPCAADLRECLGGCTPADPLAAP
jgi:hypothetical protein